MVLLVILRSKPTLCAPTHIWTAQLHTRHTYSPCTHNPDTADQHHMIPASLPESDWSTEKGNRTLWLTKVSVWCHNKIQISCQSCQRAKGYVACDDFFLCIIYLLVTMTEVYHMNHVYHFPTLTLETVFIFFFPTYLTGKTWQYLSCWLLFFPLILHHTPV